MKKKKVNRTRRKARGEATTGTVYLIVILLILFTAGLLFAGGVSVTTISPQKGTPVTIISPISETAKGNLQLYTFGYVTPPTVLAIPSVVAGPSAATSSTSSSGVCPLLDDNGIKVSASCNCLDLAVVCKSGKPFNDDGTPFNISAPNVDYPGPQADLTTLCNGSPIAPGDGRYCIAKPVIYLYPTVPTSVDVVVKTTGKIVISDPLYPKDGWKNILAYPDGKLSYMGKQYSELFYESDVADFTKPEKGIVIKREELTKRLNTILDQLGLSLNEKEEFLGYWVPRLTALNSPYIFFSVIDKSEKEKLDYVQIYPAPDTKIEFIAYFKPIPSAAYDNSLQLPSKPERKGFVSVEWGGTVDK